MATEAKKASTDESSQIPLRSKSQRAATPPSRKASEAARKAAAALKLPPFSDDRMLYDTRFFADRHQLALDTVTYHMRTVWGKRKRGQRRKLTYDEAIRFDKYIQTARHKKRLVASAGKSF